MAQSGFERSICADIVAVVALAARGRFAGIARHFWTGRMHVCLLHPGSNALMYHACLCALEIIKVTMGSTNLTRQAFSISCRSSNQLM
jgi:hypothetical protein